MNERKPLDVVFVENLRRFFKEANKTQKEVATESGVSENAITKLLRGTSQVKFSTVDRLAVALGKDRMEFYKDLA